MKIKYIVNVNLNSQTARAVQIRSNSEAFFKYLGNDFECIAVGRSEKPFRNIWVGAIEKESSLLRKVIFHFQILRFILGGQIIYSRNLSVLILAKLYGKKTVFEIHDKIGGPNLFFFRFLLRFNLKIVAISDALKNYLTKEFSVDNSSVLVAHDGVFMEKYDRLRNLSKEDLRKDLSLPLNKTIIMHTGSLHKGRGAELFKVIVKNFPEVLFVHVGGKEEDINFWREYYESYKNMTLIGHKDNNTLVKYQMSADLFFLPMTKNSSIWWCTSPMKVFEYMATGNPILASNIGSLGEIISERNALIFDPTDKQSIIEKLQFFLANKKNVNIIAKVALKDVKEEYTWDKRVHQIINFIME